MMRFNVVIHVIIIYIAYCLLPIAYSLMKVYQAAGGAPDAGGMPGGGMPDNAGGGGGGGPTVEEVD